jgi:hypothetical protein
VDRKAPAGQARQPIPLALTLIALVTGLGSAMLTWFVFTGWADNSGRGSSTWWTFYVLTLVELGTAAAVCVHPMVGRIGWRTVLGRAALALWAVDLVNFMLFVTIIRVY